MKIHELKCWPEFFAALAEGRKTFEVRSDDRGFALGDGLYLREYDADENKYSGRVLAFTVTYVGIPSKVKGIQEGFVVLGLRGGA